MGVLWVMMQAPTIQLPVPQTHIEAHVAPTEEHGNPYTAFVGFHLVPSKGSATTPAINSSQSSFP